MAIAIVEKEEFVILPNTDINEATAIAVSIFLLTILQTEAALYLAKQQGREGILHYTLKLFRRC